MDGATLDALRETLRGPVIGPQDDAYDETRAIYNAMIDRHPAAFARCVDATDVIRTVRFARERGLDLAVRGGGHSGPGLCVVDDALTLDLSLMRWVRVDPVTRTAWVGAGSQLGDLDHAAHGFGLGTPSGINSTTGVGGLTLGGGHGYLTRKYGLTADNLLGADIVLADGTFVTVSEDERPDLFWALRGGGGNFGVITSFTYRLYPVDTIGFGVTVWPVERTREVLEWYRDFLPGAAEDVYGFFALFVVPPGPPFPEEIHGQKVCGVVWCLTGDLGRTDEIFAAVGQPGPPAFHFATPMPYPALQSMFDELYRKGLQWYWRGAFFDRIDDDSIDVHLTYGQNLPTPLSTMHLYPVDGAAHRVGPDETAWGYRDAVWSGVIAGVDPDPANAELVKEWSGDYCRALHPYSMGGSYVNFMGADEGRDRVLATYRRSYERLAEIKRAYDPDNFFHANQNIKPTGSPEPAKTAGSA
ncbi:FAD-binding oxidoreductase [Streptomyces sp. NPDC127197]|uniref:FAD-binding oxidoreductase n=1 Tax=Streptomyces sp. NPDC127197 TaxID=3345388 RepID=UPI003645BE73